MQAHEGPRLQTLLEYLQVWGVTRVVFPGHEYRSERAGKERNNRRSLYETARLWPRGDDGGFADEFLRRRNDTP
jgi:hypothetical protein